MLSILSLHLVPILYFLSGLENVKGGIELLSSSDSDIVCPGEEFTLICQTNEAEIEILRWNVNFPSGDPTSIRKSIPIEGTLPPESFIHLTTHGAAVFNIARISDNNTHPLVTELVIIEVNVGINGTEISCSKADFSNQHTIVIHIIDGDIPESPVVNTTDNYFGMTTVTVILEWMQKSGVTYNISVYPTAELKYTRDNILLLMIPYNIRYHIDIVATLCGQYNATTTLMLNYAACSHHLALDLRQGVFSDISVTVTDVVREGTNMTLSCLSGLILIGSNTSTCTETGQWEPDPREVECVHLACVPPSSPPNGYINFYSSKSSITFVCQNSTPAEEVRIISHCNLFGKWVPNPTEICSGSKQSSHINILILIGSSASCFVLSSVICLLLGCCCLISTRYKKKQTVERNSTVENDGSFPIYEDLLPSVPIKSKDNELKLKENMAYNSLEVRWH